MTSVDAFLYRGKGSYRKIHANLFSLRYYVDKNVSLYFEDYVAIMTAYELLKSIEYETDVEKSMRGDYDYVLFPRPTENMNY